MKVPKYKIVDIIELVELFKASLTKIITTFFKAIKYPFNKFCINS